MSAFTRLIDRREAFPVHQLLPNVNPLKYCEASNNVLHWPVTHVIVVCAVRTRPSPQIPENCLPTKYARVPCRSHRDAAMLFCPSFTQSERFLHTDQLITRHDKLHSRAGWKRDRERAQVRCSDLVGSDLPLSLIDHRCSTNCCTCQSPRALRCAA